MPDTWGTLRTRHGIHAQESGRENAAVCAIIRSGHASPDLEAGDGRNAQRTDHDAPRCRAIGLLERAEPLAGGAAAAARGGRVLPLRGPYDRYLLPPVLPR